MVFRLTAVLFKLTRETFYSGDIPDFGAKDLIPTGLRSRVIDKFSSAGCSACCIGEIDTSTSTESWVCITVSISTNPPRVKMTLCKHGKSALLLKPFII